MCLCTHLCTQLSSTSVCRSIAHLHVHSFIRLIIIWGYLSIWLYLWVDGHIWACSSVYICIHARCVCMHGYIHILLTLYDSSHEDGPFLLHKCFMHVPLHVCMYVRGLCWIRIQMTAHEWLLLGSFHACDHIFFPCKLLTPAKVVTGTIVYCTAMMTILNGGIQFPAWHPGNPFDFWELLVLVKESFSKTWMMLPLVGLRGFPCVSPPAPSIKSLIKSFKLLIPLITYGQSLGM